MEFIQIENSFVAIVLIILAALIPIAIIWMTIRAFRKKRERGVEKAEGKNFTSVKEERLNKSQEKQDQFK